MSSQRTFKRRRSTSCKRLQFFCTLRLLYFTKKLIYQGKTEFPKKTGVVTKGNLCGDGGATSVSSCWGGKRKVDITINHNHPYTKAPIF